MYIENYEDKDEKTFIKIVDNVLTVVFNCFWGFLQSTAINFHWKNVDTYIQFNRKITLSYR